MTERQQATTVSRWQLYTAGALILVVVIGIGAQWWIGRSKQFAEHFIVVLSKGQISDVTAMLADPAAIQSNADGSITIRAADGSSASLGRDELPLVALVAPNAQSRIGGGDYIAGRYRFQVASSGSAVQNGQREPTEVHCIADGGRIVVESVKQ